MKNNIDFEYNYSAPTSRERKEIESIRNSYLQPQKEMGKLQYLRKLDHKVKSIPTMWSLIVGIVGLLIFGLGIAMILEWQLIVLGVIVGVVGLVPVSLAYLVYQVMSARLRSRYGAEIVAISDE